MADESKNVKLNIDPNVLNSNGLKDFLKDLERIDKLTDRIYKKGKNNNFTISAKDNANLRGVAGNIQQGANNANEQLNKAMSSYDAIKNGSMQGSSKDLAKLEQLSYKLMSALYKAQSKGYNPNTGTINPNGHFNDILNFKVNSRNRNFSAPTGKDAERFNDYNSRMKVNLRNLGSQVNNVGSNSNKLNTNVGNTIRYGTVSSERLNQYRSSLNMGPERIKDLTNKINTQNTGYTAQRDNIASQIDEITKKEKAGNFSPQEVQSENARKIALQSQLEGLNKSIEKLKQFTDTLNDANNTFKKTSTNLEGAVSGNASSSGEGLQVKAAKNSLAGMISARKSSIAIGAAGTAISGLTSVYAAGSNIRTSAEQYVDPIMLSQANNNGVTGRADNTILKNLANVGINNGTGYTGTQMAQFANAYTSSTGNSSDYLKAANAYSKLSRYTGMGTSSTLSLESAAGNAGVTNTNFAKAVAGEISNSGMTAKSEAQAASLTSLLSSESKYGVSNSNANELSALQGEMSKYGTTMQGSNFTSSYSALSGEATNYNSNVSRYLFGGNSAKYAGVGGQARLLDDMESARKDPSKMKNYIANVLKTNGNNKEQAAYVMDMASNGKMSMSQAKKWISAYRKGDLNSKQLAEKVQQNIKTSSKNGNSSYNSSGESTINKKTAINNRAEQETSNTADGLRRGTNFVAGMVPGAALGVMGTLGIAAATSGKDLVGLGAASAATKGFGFLGKTKLGSKLADSKIGSWISKTFGKSGSSSSASKIMGLDGKPLEAEGESGILSKFTNLGKGALNKGKSLLSKGKGLFSKFGKSGATEDIESGVEDAAKSGGKGILSKASGIAAAAFTGLDVYHTLKTTKSGTKKRHKELGSDIGSGIGGAIGGVVGAVGGVPGSIAASAAGSWAGGKIGGFIGGLFGNKKKDSNTVHASEVPSDSKSEKTKSDTKRSKLNKEQKTLLKGFNDMLSKAEKTIAEAKTLLNNNSSSSDSDNVTSGNDSSTSGGGSAWEKQIKAAAKKAGVNLSKTQLSNIEKLITAESSGNQSITGINDNDGTGAAQGLLQYKKGTFSKYALSGETDIDSGTDQLDAFFNNSNWSSDLSTWAERYAKGETGWNPTGKATKANGGFFNYHTHASGGIFNGATAIGDNIVAEAGTEAAIPMNAAHRLEGESMLNQVSRAMGKVVLSPTELSSLQGSSSSSSGISMSPSYNITIAAGSNSNTSEISKAVKAATAQANAELTSKLRRYYGNTI